MVGSGEAQKEPDARLFIDELTQVYNERYLKIVDYWTHAREKVGEDLMGVLKEDFDEKSGYINPIYCMVSSGRAIW